MKTNERASTQVNLIEHNDRPRPGTQTDPTNPGGSSFCDFKRSQASSPGSGSPVKYGINQVNSMNYDPCHDPQQ
jgi:hypothetical protein